MNRRTFIGIGAAVVLAGCSGAPQTSTPSAKEVVVYAALDQEFSEPILAQFTKDTGIAVRTSFDTEATKTVGLAQRLIAEKARPRCDVFWNNEIVNTFRLKRAGLLAEYRSPAAAPYPKLFQGADGLWHGFAARARILLVNNNLVPEDKEPRSIFDLTKPQWKGKVGVAKPLFGTTATHAACLFAALGEVKAKAFFRDLKANDVRILAGNKQVALSVAAGEVAVGLTDTDDAVVEVEKGKPVRIVYLDAAKGELGTLFIPNTLAVIAGAPHSEEAKALVDYLLGPSVEKALAEGPSAQIPLNPQVRAAVKVKTPKDVQPMEVDFEKAADQWDSVQRFLTAEFTAP